MTVIARPRPAIVAVDLGASNCRVSLLRWIEGKPCFSLVHRFPNAPVQKGDTLCWDIDAIFSGIVEGLRRCAVLAPEGIASIAADGWAVDYVRLGPDGLPLAAPFCYRDTRNIAAEEAVHTLIASERLYEITGAQRLRFNTIYQLYADRMAGLTGAPWLNLPEYVLYRLGGRCVAEYTNATHTGLIDLKTKSWSEEIFQSLGFDLRHASKLVSPGTDIGRLQGPLTLLPAFRDTRLIAPACHDTASAIAGIPRHDDDWAYISSGTWSLIGTVLNSACNTPQALAENFTNLGAAGGRICFHKSINGMWLIQQCMEHWAEQGTSWPLSDLLQQAENLEKPKALLDLNDENLLLPGNMPSRIHAQLTRRGLKAIPETPEGAPAVANLIFHSLAARYTDALQGLQKLTGKTFRELCVVGGGSRNYLINRYTQEASGLKVSSGHVESSTIGNFAIQLALANAVAGANRSPSAREIAQWAEELASTICEERV